MYLIKTFVDLTVNQIFFLVCLRVNYILDIRGRQSENNVRIEIMIISTYVTETVCALNRAELNLTILSS